MLLASRASWSINSSGGSRRRKTSEKLRLPRLICVRVVCVVLECDLLVLVGEEQLMVDRRIVTGDEIGEIEDEDELLGASESLCLKFWGVEASFSFAVESRTLIDSRPIDPWLMLELIGDGGTGAIFDTQ